VKELVLLGSSGHGRAKGCCYLSGVIFDDQALAVFRLMKDRYVF
jgi:hypothetical protein